MERGEPPGRDTALSGVAVSMPIDDESACSRRDGLDMDARSTMRNFCCVRTRSAKNVWWRTDRRDVKRAVMYFSRWCSRTRTRSTISSRTPSLDLVTPIAPRSSTPSTRHARETRDPTSPRLNGTRAPELCSLIGAAAPPTSAARSSIYFLEQHTRTEMRPAIIPDKGTGTDSRSRTPTPHETCMDRSWWLSRAHPKATCNVRTYRFDNVRRRHAVPPAPAAHRRGKRAGPSRLQSVARGATPDHATPTTTWTSEFGNTPASTSVCPSARSSLSLMKSLCVFGSHPVP